MKRSKTNSNTRNDSMRPRTIEGGLPDFTSDNEDAATFKVDPQTQRKEVGKITQPPSSKNG